MCDWPVFGMSGRIDNARRCANNGIHEVGPLTVCPKHLDVLVEGVAGVMREQASRRIQEGLKMPGGIEERMLEVVAEIDRERRPARYAAEGRPPCIYFAEREGYVKIGTTVDLATRMRTLAAGSAMLKGMTAGPLALLATMPGGLDEEKALHRRFARLRVDRNREWFRYEGKLREFVEALTPAEHLV